ncbi:hypothetical protein HYQ45_004891 [Verticillium longisporum]|uniref:Uncharacterized protein n=1 Tax=Verticillium longisporum TaxID=100787 RepID=A0A8I2ZUB9_VERLO|nr:hypothetical protein HYQ45_004891 [Verticillium longisporum]
MASTSPSAVLRQRIEATVKSFLATFEDGSIQNDASIINRDVTDDCKRYILPAPLRQAFGLPDDFFFDNAKFEEAFARDIGVLKFRNNILSDLVIDTEARRAAITAIAEVHEKTGEMYLSESAWFLYFNEDGSKVEKVTEFCDKDAIVRMAQASA